MRLELFSAIAPKYDLLNHLLSLGIDRRWRRTLIDRAKIQPGERVLDLCAGTGDIAIEIARRGCAGEVVGVDLSGRMLELAQQKIERRGLGGKITLQEGDCLKLPFEDRSFDVVIIGFGLRNLADYERGIAEMARMLKEGGRLLILEFSLPQNPLLSGPYRLYLDKFIPAIGGLISGKRNAYRYLASSIQGFLEREEVLGLLKAQGLRDLRLWELTGGIASIYRGER
ncbi:MAG: bifunctional demethylmenaquinone methyltransferase/2-methoxy-6-polyprenyl-1,4-benzoquinol methylase UbiE [Candidatus Bipolaricaulia bacterium]